jgi:hypothetical protein
MSTLKAPLLREGIAQILREGVVRRAKASESESGGESDREGLAGHFTSSADAHFDVRETQAKNAPPLTTSCRADAPESAAPHRGWKGSLRAQVTQEFRSVGARVYIDVPLPLRDAQYRELAHKLQQMAQLAEEISGRARSLREHEIAEDMSGIGAWVSEHARTATEKGGGLG